METLVIRIVLLLICGGAASAIAAGKNRNAVGWFFGGFFLGIIGIIIVAVLKDPVEEENRWNQTSRENRRLKEQLHQEKVKNESFRQYATNRLDTHDQHIGVNTKTIKPEPMIETAAPHEESYSHFLDR